MDHVFDIEITPADIDPNSNRPYWPDTPPLDVPPLPPEGFVMGDMQYGDNKKVEVGQTAYLGNALRGAFLPRRAFLGAINSDRMTHMFVVRVPTNKWLPSGDIITSA